MSETIDHDDVLTQAAAWREAGKGVALATVVQTWGSSPRPVGSQLAVDESGEGRSVLRLRADRRLTGLATETIE